MAWPLSDNGHAVRLVGTHLDGNIIESCKRRRVHPTLRRELPVGVEAFGVEAVGEAVRDADVVVSGVNSRGVRWLGETIGRHLRAEQVIIAVTKGLEVSQDGQLHILPDVLRSTLPRELRESVPLAAIGGPCIAGELAGRRPTCVVFGCRDAVALDQLAALFRTSYYHIWTTTDLIALEYCAALKNAYALGVGLARGLLQKAGGADAAGAQMHNLAAALFGRACAEMERVLALVGATRRFAYSLPGAGDLYVTSVGGRTTQCGALLGEGRSMAQVREIMAGATLEGAEILRVMGQALPVLMADGRLRSEELPMLRALVDVVVHGHPVMNAIDALFGHTGVI